MKELNMKLTGKIIKELREAAGESQEQLAVALNAPNRETIARWENGSRDLKREHIITIAQHFNVTSDYILGLSDISSVDEDIQTVCKVTGLSEENVRLLSDFDVHKDILNYFLDARIEGQEFRDSTIMLANNNIFLNMIYEISEYCKCLVNMKKYLTLRRETDNEINGSSPINMKVMDSLRDISLTELRFQEYGLSISTPDEKLIGIEGVLQKYLSKMLDEIGKKYIADISKERDSNAKHNPKEE